MNLSKVDLLFWAMSFIGNLALLFVLLFRGRFRNFPIFTALVTLNVVRTITLFLIRWHSAQSTYFYAFWSLAVVDMGLQFGIVYELSSKVFRPVGEWAPDIRKRILIWVSASVILASLLTLIPKPASRFWIQGLILKGSFFSAALMSELFVGMIVLSAVAGLSWSSHLAKIAKGFTVYSIATLVLETANTFLGLGGTGHIYDDLSRIRIAIYLCCVAYWIVALWRNAPPARKIPDHVWQQASTINQMVKIRVEALRQEGES
jgi:hypothetical protein